MRVLLLSVFTWLGITGLHALTKETLDSETIEIQISYEDVNRISVEDGAIVDLIFDKSKLKATLHPSTGSAFVCVTKGKNLEKPASLSITTGSGEIQTFVISTREGAGEVVILKPMPETFDQEVSLSTDYHSHTIDLLGKVLSGKHPEGYGVRDVSEMDLLSAPDPLKAKALKAFEGPFDTLFLFEIFNRSRRPVSIDKNALKREGDLWVFLPKETLIPGETIFCIISTQKEG